MIPTGARVLDTYTRYCPERRAAAAVVDYDVALDLCPVGMSDAIWRLAVDALLAQIKGPHGDPVHGGLLEVLATWGFRAARTYWRVRMSGTARCVAIHEARKVANLPPEALPVFLAIERGLSEQTPAEKNARVEHGMALRGNLEKALVAARAAEEARATLGLDVVRVLRESEPGALKRRKDRAPVIQAIDNRWGALLRKIESTSSRPEKPSAQHQMVLF